jgi:hypothetical protein
VDTPIDVPKEKIVNSVRSQQPVAQTPVTPLFIQLPKSDIYKINHYP